MTLLFLTTVFLLLNCIGLNGLWRWRQIGHHFLPRDKHTWGITFGFYAIRRLKTWFFFTHKKENPFVRELTVESWEMTGGTCAVWSGEGTSHGTLNLGRILIYKMGWSRVWDNVHGTMSSTRQPSRTNQDSCFSSTAAASPPVLLKCSQCWLIM